MPLKIVGEITLAAEFRFYQENHDLIVSFIESDVSKEKFKVFFS